MNKYEQTVDAELDLHGYTADEARMEINDFLEEGREKGWHRVRIVVGKGLHSKHGPVLPYRVQACLREHGLEWKPAKLEFGGEGAYEVNL